MQATAQSPRVLDIALTALLQVVTPTADILYKLYYEQTTSTRQPLVTSQGGATVFEFPSPSLGLAFDDRDLEAVKTAWKLVMKDEAANESYMKFEDREGLGDDDDD
jgi:Rab proteins geranylgeranyltransferase component A